MTAADYDVTFAYGAMDGYYYGPNGIIGPYHRGDDRAMDIGTSVVVSGTQIGLSGNTGATSGPHLHIGKFVNGKDVNPNEQGFSIGQATVIYTGFDATNGNMVKLQDSSGAVWVYLHLSHITAQVGQKIGGSVAIITTEAVVAQCKAVTGRQPANEEEKYYINKEATQANLDGFITYWAGKSRIAELEALVQPATVLKPGNYRVNL